MGDYSIEMLVARGQGVLMPHKSGLAYRLCSRSSSLLILMWRELALIEDVDARMVRSFMKY